MISLKESELKLTLFISGWEKTKVIFDKYPAWKNENDQVIWYVQHPSNQCPPYYVFCNNKNKIYTEKWINIYTLEDLNNCLGATND